MKQAIDLIGQFSFYHMMKIEARAKARLGWPVYFYLISYWNRCHTNHSMLPVRGSQNAIEQPYWFNLWIYPVVTPFPVTAYLAGDIAFQELGVSSMVQFVKTGDPSLPSGPRWPPVKPSGPLDFKRLDTVPVEGLWEEEDQFWEGIRTKYPFFDVMRGNHRGGCRWPESPAAGTRVHGEL